MSSDTPLPPFEPVRHDAPGATRTAYVVYNPTAGGARNTVRIEDVCARFNANGWNAVAVPTRAAGDGTEAARFALGERADVVVAMGGDGTLNEVTQAMVHGETPVGIVPIGTVNVLARELDISLDALEAVDVVTGGEPLTIDLGRANERYFTMMIGLGYDAAAAMQMMPQIKKWSGQLAYWVGAVQAYAKHKAVRTQLIMAFPGGKKRRLRRLMYLCVISNTHLYGDGALKFTPDANVCDGLLDLCLLRTARWYRSLLHIVLGFTGRLRGERDVEYFRLEQVTIKTARPFPYQIDGDPAGHTPVTVAIVPGALRVLVPRRPGP